MKTIKEGSKWSANDHKTFRVIQIVEVDNHVWIHYINEATKIEYSCYQESFESRFKELPE